MRAHLLVDPAETPVQRVNRLLASERGDRYYPLHFWSRDLLFSPAAWLTWVKPALRAITEC